jgi:hypothetical protein
MNISSQYQGPRVHSEPRTHACKRCENGMNKQVKSLQSDFPFRINGTLVFSALLQFWGIFTPGFPNSFGLSITEGTLLVEMRIWCIKIGIVLVLYGICNYTHACYLYSFFVCIIMTWKLDFPFRCGNKLFWKEMPIHVCLFVYFHLSNFSTFWRLCFCHHYQSCKFRPLLSNYRVQQCHCWGYVYMPVMPHMLRRENSVFKVISESPVILTLKYRALAKEQTVLIIKS